MNTFVFYLLMPALSFLCYLTLPAKWKRTKIQKIVIALVASFAILSSYIMISIARFTEAYAVREIFVYVTLFFYILTSASIVFFLIRYIVTFLAVNMHHYRSAAILLDSRSYLIGVAALTAFSLLFGALHFDRPVITDYDVNMTDGSVAAPSQCKIGMICDVHLGAGANSDAVDHICELLTAENFDLICVCGDVLDMTSFRSDAEYFAEKLAAVPTRYGIYYADGNHEQDADIDPETILTEHGIRCLYDEAEELENGLVVVGRRYDSEISVDTVLREAGLEAEGRTVVLQHIPKGLAAMEEHSYLVLCGHTHGYASPISGLLMPFKSELPYGYRRFGELQAITSSGISSWGFRSKWPSCNEIVTVRFIY